MAAVALPSALGSNAPRDANVIVSSQRRYTILRVLGHGADGIVFAVSPRGNTARQLAIKVNNLLPGSLESIMKEIEVLKVMSTHRARHIVQLRGVFPLRYAHYDDGNPEHALHHSSLQEIRMAILMEKLPCESIEREFLPVEIFNSDDALSRPEIRTIAIHLLQALEDLHALGYVQRDLKPDNMVYNREKENTVLYDFGMAKKCDDKSWDEYVGTPLYWAPEYAFQQNYDMSADVWSLGALLFELYEGDPLIPAECDFEDNNVSDQWLADYWHLMIQNMGLSPTPKFIESIPDPLRSRLFQQQSDLSYQITLLPSEGTQRWYTYFESIRRKVTEKFPHVAHWPLWQLRMLYAAQQKEHPPYEAEMLIRLIDPMLHYKHRKSAAKILEWIERSLTSEKNEPRAASAPKEILKTA